MTTFMNIDAANRRVEIGATWYRKSVQRSEVNTQSKLLLLTHAFETLDCIAVEFRTHFFNQQSRRAIERLGAKLDGILRNHQRTTNGTLRDTCVYSIIAAEWPTVKAHLRVAVESAASVIATLAHRRNGSERNQTQQARLDEIVDEFVRSNRIEPTPPLALTPSRRWRHPSAHARPVSDRIHFSDRSSACPSAFAI